MVTPATRVFMVRHGATVLSSEDRFAGATDVELSDEGRAQAARLAARLAPEPIAAVYCSPMRRTVDTATLLARPHGRTPIVDAALREIDHGSWEGLKRSDVEAGMPAAYAAWEADPFTSAPERGESGLAVLARALPVVRAIVLAHCDERVLVVSHKATLRLVIGSLLGFDLRSYRDRLDQHPACLNILDFKDSGRARLTLFNDISHYADHPAPPCAHLSKWWDTATS